jgi:hypothetical protein
MAHVRAAAAIRKQRVSIWCDGTNERGRGPPPKLWLESVVSHRELHSRAGRHLALSLVRERRPLPPHLAPQRLSRTRSQYATGTKVGGGAPRRRPRRPSAAVRRARHRLWRWCPRRYMRPRTAIYVSSYFYICVLTLLCMRPRTAMYIYMSSYCYVSSVLILLYVCSHTGISLSGREMLLLARVLGE